MIFPELSLFAGAAARLCRVLCLRVQRTQWEVPVGEFDLSLVFCEQACQDSFGLLAIGTLEIGELNDGNRSFGVSSYPGGIVADLHFWRQHKHDYFSFGAQCISIILPCLLGLQE